MKRVDSEIQKSLADIISKLDDGEFANEIISIMKVETFADFSMSKIYISTLGSAEKREKVVEKLNSNKKFLRYELAHHMRFRTVPDLLFIADTFEEKSSKVLKLFETIEGENNDK